MDTQLLFLVLRPKSEVYKMASELQRKIASHFNLYRQLPMLHVTMLQMSGPVENKIIQKEIIDITSQVIADAPPVILITSDFKCLSISNRALTLKLKKTPSLLVLSNKLKKALKSISKIKLITRPSEEEIFHITIASSLFSSNPWTEASYNEVCSLLERKKTGVKSKTRCLQLWRPQLKPQEAIIHSFKLGERE